MCLSFFNPLALSFPLSLCPPPPQPLPPAAQAAALPKHVARSAVLSAVLSPKHVARSAVLSAIVLQPTTNQRFQVRGFSKVS
ncbi:hypothetical protein ACS0TY_011002 [Phlomoides rotata]